MESRKIPKRELWPPRYRAYRKKYGRFKAFWRGIVLAELGPARWIRDDEIELMQHLVTVEAVGVELRMGPRTLGLKNAVGSLESAILVVQLCGILLLGLAEKFVAWLRRVANLLDKS